MNNVNNSTAAVSQALLGANDKGRVSYEVNGETVNLSFPIVRNYLTRGDATVTDAECIMFISLCKANKLNPFLGDAYLVKYDQRSPATMVTARDAFAKRAEGGPGFEGFQSGVIVLRDGKVEELEGAFFLPGDTLIGGWARVYRADRKFPNVQRVRLAEYNTGKSTWATKPATMIQKVAEAHAFRKAFPMATAGLYTPEELPDEQGGQPAPAQVQGGAPNVAIAQFTEAPAERVIDQPAPEEQADPEPPEFTADQEPEQVADKEPKEFTHWAGEKSFEFNPPIKVPVQKDEVDPTGERLPWEGKVIDYDVCDKFCRVKNCDYMLGAHGELCVAAKKRALSTELGEDANLNLFKA